MKSLREALFLRIVINDNVNKEIEVITILRSYLHCMYQIQSCRINGIIKDSDSIKNCVLLIHGVNSNSTVNLRNRWG